MLYTERSTCRICGGKFKDIVSLGDIYLSTFVDEDWQGLPKIPIDLVQCVECGLTQLRHTVNPDTMYKHDYWYQSGLNKSMVDALREIKNNAQNRIKLQQDDIIVDIGANDGTLLRMFRRQHENKNITRIAFEPSNLASLADEHCEILINDFFSACGYWKAADRKAKLITSIAMFYDLENPKGFVEEIANILHEDGMWIIQMMDLKSMVEHNDFPNLCHEHLEYYTLETLSNLLESCGLEIYDIEFNNVNGGSMRVYVFHKGTKTPRKQVKRYLNIEQTFFRDIDLASHFKNNIENVKEKVTEFIFDAVKCGEKVAVLGASTKGNTTLQYFGLNDTHIDHAAEVNPSKFGRKTVGSNIPIIPQSESLKMSPDYYLVLPWGFVDFFLSKFRKYLDNGGAFIVPLPHPRIITIEKNKICTINL